ncbi:AEC family transporter [Kamptonema cortianum]|nr:AEC family transporter [Oscillatoria laete-virens]MDK3156420.1 AEC family transporter [Kamptonema cortianum]MDL5046279.1 AEC family transporter [Oscillatoria amoena NRMC-F 0135]MDL5053901.1 AEC family transporter [Oscillatoria laete-virens NRMC-F 0139]
MDDYLHILESVIPIFLIMILGAFVRAARWLNRQADDTLMKLAINVLFPCLIFEKILGNPALNQPENVLLPPIIGFAATVLGFFVAWHASRFFGLVEPVQRRTFAVTVGIFNFGYIPIPLIMDFFGVQTLGVLFVFNLGVDVAIWTVGIGLLTGSNPLKKWKSLLSGPLIAIFAGLLTNLFVERPQVSPIFVTSMQMLGGSAIPVILLLIGATMFDYFRPGVLRESKAVSIGACLLRLMILPVCFLLTAKFIPMTDELRQVLAVQAAMATGVFPLVMTRHYQGDVPTAFRVIFTTSIISLLTIPLWLRFGLWWIAS